METKNCRKRIEVVAAIIIEDGKVFVTQRGYGDFKDGWELPGGKIEVGETREQALKRELVEELDIEINVENLIKTIEFEYPKFHLTMHCFLSQIVKGRPKLIEHESACWVDKKNIGNLDWLPADLEIIEDIKKLL